MSFSIIDYDGTDLAVLAIEPNVRAEGAVGLAYRFATRVDTGNSGRENREPDQPDLRVQQVLTYTLRTAAEAAALRARLATLGDALIAVPLWVDRLSGADWAERIHTGLILRLSDGAVLARDDDLDDQEDYVPLLVGRFEAQPDLAPWGKESGAALQLTLVDDSPWDYRVEINATAVAGTWPASLVPNYTSTLKDRSDAARTYEEIGRGRERGIEGQEMAFKWGQEADFLLKSRAEIRLLLATFVAHQGRLAPLTMPWWFTPAPDAPATPHTTTVRFARDEVRMAFTGGAAAKVNLAFWQMPWEIDPEEGEEAAQAPRAFLYKHTLAVPVSPVVWRYTDWAQPITVAEGETKVTYFPTKIEHDKITQDYLLVDDAVSLKSFVADNHPWMLAIRRRLEAPLQLEIYEVDPTAKTLAAVLRHAGELGDPRGTGRKLSVASTGLSAQLDIKVPAFRAQQGCNYEFCGAGCGLDMADHVRTGTVDAIDGNTIDVDIDETLAADFFATGDCDFGSGLTYEGREIIRSSELGSGVHRLVLSHAFRGLAVDASINLRPNCPGTPEACKGFGNFINYGGHWDIGTNNISVPSRESAISGGKK